MKTRIKGDKGRIECKTSSFADVEFMFNSETLVDWYPLDINYEYRYSEKADLMYLVPLERSKEEWKYGIGATTGRAKSEVASFKLDTWFNKEVQESNRLDMELGKRFGLITLNDPYTKQSVKDNIKILNEEIELAVLDSIENKMIDKMTRKEYDDYRRMTEENRDGIRLQYASERDLEMLEFFGKMRTMTNLMRQGAKM